MKRLRRLAASMQRNRLARSAALVLCALAAYGILHVKGGHTPHPPAGPGGVFWWSTMFAPNAVDSSWTALAFLPSMDGRSGEADLPVMLWARCRANTYETAVWVHYHTALRPDNRHADGEAYKAVTVRMDSSAGYTQRWRVSDYAQQAVHAPNPVALLMEMSRADRLVLELEQGRRTTRAAWNTTGTATYLRELANHCRWTFPPH